MQLWLLDSWVKHAWKASCLHGSFIATAGFHGDETLSACDEQTWNFHVQPMSKRHGNRDALPWSSWVDVNRFSMDNHGLHYGCKLESLLVSLIIHQTLNLT
ncbi:hypothetical protein Dimus_015339 [Dionaea muscipula]